LSSDAIELAETERSRAFSPRARWLEAFHAWSRSNKRESRPSGRFYRAKRRLPWAWRSNRNTLARDEDRQECLVQIPNSSKSDGV